MNFTLIRFLLKQNYKLLSGEWVTLAYVLVTTVFLVLNLSKLSSPVFFFGIRLATVLTIFAFAFVAERKADWRLLKAIRPFLPFFLLGYWYSETYDFAGFFLDNKDLFFYHADERLFGGQPSLLFSSYLPETWFSELMYFGYFSYYLIAFLIPFRFWHKHPEESSRAFFVVLCAFYIYYAIYIIVPVAGPQFFLNERLAKVPSGYFFSHVIHYIQMFGEKPTGAFPSSHVGISTVVLLLTFSKARYIFWKIIPLYLVLVFSTVYIKAHYLVDVLAGFVSGGLFYYTSNKLYDYFSNRSDKNAEHYSSGNRM